jgi:hypothetical protein
MTKASTSIATQQEVQEDLQAAFAQYGARGILDLISGIRYIHRDLWVVLLQVLEDKFNKAIRVRAKQDGGFIYTSLRGEPGDYLTDDHKIFTLDILTEPELNMLDLGLRPRWAICSGCGEVMRVSEAVNTAFSLVLCRGTMDQQGNALVVKAVPLGA